MININNVCFYLLEKSRTKIKKHMKAVAFNESYYLTEDDKEPDFGYEETVDTPNGTGTKKKRYTVGGTRNPETGEMEGEIEVDSTHRIALDPSKQAEVDAIAKLRDEMDRMAGSQGGSGRSSNGSGTSNTSPSPSTGSTPSTSPSTGSTPSTSPSPSVPPPPAPTPSPQPPPPQPVPPPPAPKPPPYDKNSWWVSPSEKGTAEGNFGGNYKPDSTPEQRRDAWNKSGRSSPGYSFNVKNTANWGAGVDVDNAKQPPTSTTTEQPPTSTTTDEYEVNKMRGSLEEPEDTTSDSYNINKMRGSLEEPSSSTRSKPSIPQPPPSFIEDDGINVKGVTDNLNGGTSLITPEILAPPKPSSSVNSTPSKPSVPQPPPSTSTPSPSTANSSSSTNVAAAKTNISGVPSIKIPKELTNTLAAMGVQKPQDSGIDDEGNVDLNKLLTKSSNISPDRLLKTSLNDMNDSEGSPNQRRSRDPYQT